MNASSGWDAASDMINSECAERIKISSSFVNESDSNNAFHELNLTDETRKYTLTT